MAAIEVEVPAAMRGYTGGLGPRPSKRPGPERLWTAASANLNTVSAAIRAGDARLMRTHSPTAGLLPCHRQVQPFLRSDEVIVAILAQVELHPVDLPVKHAGLARVV